MDFCPKKPCSSVAFLDLLYEENQGSSPTPPLSTIELSNNLTDFHFNNVYKGAKCLAEYNQMYIEN